MESDLNCEHYTRTWVLDCVLSGLVYQITELGVDEESVDALAPPPAEALATALSEVALDAAATLAYEEEESGLRGGGGGADGRAAAAATQGGAASVARNGGL